MLRRALPLLLPALVGCEAAATATTADARAATDAAADASLVPRDVITPRDGSSPADVTLPPPPDAGRAANTTCATATTVAPGIYGDVPAHLGAQPAACSERRPALWYAIRVPTGHRVSAQVVALNTGNTPVAVALTRGCDVACLATGSWTAGWTNEGPEADVRVAVWAREETSDGRLQLSVSVAPPAANAACAGAEPLGASILGDVVRSVAPPPACLARPAWRTVYYRATIPPAATLTIVQREGATAVQGFAILDGCDASGCLASSTPAPGAAAVLRYTNTLATPRDVVIAAAAQPTAPDGLDPQVNADARVVPAAENTTCARAATMRDGDAREGELPSASATAAPACDLAGPESNALFYSVRVGAGEQLAVAAQTSFVTSRLRIFEGCAPTTCLATRAGVSSNVATWENTGSAARDVTVALSLDPADSLDPARVRVAVRAVPYRVSRGVARCDDMTGAPAWTTSTSFLGSTERRSVPLPFAFPWFGRAMRHVVPSYLGYAELWPDAHVSPYDGTGGGALPIPTRGDAVAPFFDDIVTSPAPTITTRAVAGSPARFTVQWSNVFLAGATDGPLTFQAWLIEDGSVEFHHCSMGTSPRATGATASIGVQGGAGPFARVHAIRQAGSAQTGDAVRFAP